MANKKQAELTIADEFYIKNNLNKTDVELAKDIDKPLPIVQEYIHKTQGGGRINNLLIREKGCVIMTEGASMATNRDNRNTDYDTRQNDELLARQRQEEYVYFMHKPKNNSTNVRK